MLSFRLTLKQMNMQVEYTSETSITCILARVTGECGLFCFLAGGRPA